MTPEQEDRIHLPVVEDTSDPLNLYTMLVRYINELLPPSDMLHEKTGDRLFRQWAGKSQIEVH